METSNEKTHHCRICSQRIVNSNGSLRTKSRPVHGFARYFLDDFKNGTLAAGKKAGATVQVEDAQNDVGKQLRQIKNLIAQQVDAIIVNPVDTDATEKLPEW